MTSLSRDAFTKPATVPTETVELPALGGAVIVRGLTAKGRTDFERQLQTKSGKPSPRKQQEMRERLCIACCVDSDGAALFTESDIEMLGNQPATVIEPIVNAAMRVCGLSGNDLDTLGNSEETEESS